MSTSEAELNDMLGAAYRLGRGPAKFAALDAVFRHADAAGQTAFGFRARMGALSELHHNGEYARAFMAFSWCLSTFDRQPEVAGPSGAHSLLWRFKWIVWQLSQISAVPLDRALALLDDMQRRYQAGNHSLHAVHQHRALVATHLGDLDAAGHWFGEMATARRDNLSDCRACVPTSEVEYLIARGRFEDAVTAGAPFTDGGCSEQPQQMLSQLLTAYLHTGRLDEAVRAHKRAYELIRGNRHYLELIGLHVQFCGLTGNEAYALPIVERHLSWLDRPASPYAAMEFASAAALVLRRLAAHGEAGSPVLRRTDSGDRRWSTTVAETSEELAALARSHAADFDRRNGNAYQSGRIAARLAAEPLVESLPFTVLTGRPIAEHPGKRAVDELVRRVADQTAAGDAAGAARTRLEVAYALRNAAQWGDALETAEEARRSLDQAGLTADGLMARHLLVELYGRARRPGEARAALDELLAAPSLPPSLPPRVVLLEETALPAYGPRAADQLFEAAAIHRAAGDRAAEVRTLAKAVRLCRVVPAAWPETVARLDEIIAPGSDFTELQDQICRVEMLAGRVEAALTRAERHAGSGARLALRAAEALLRLARFAEADARARPLVQDEGVGWEAAVVVAKSLRARALDASDFMAAHDLDEYDLDDDV